MASIGIAAAGLVGLYFFYLFLILPCVVIYKYIKTDAFDKPSIFWVLAIFLFGPLPAFIYSIKYLESKFLKISSWIGIAVVLAGLGFGILSVGYLKKEFRNNSNSVKISVSNSKNTDQLEDADFIAVYDNVDTLSAEFRKSSWLTSPKTRMKSIELISILTKFMDDQDLSRSEYEQWKTLYSTRADTFGGL